MVAKDGEGDGCEGDGDGDLQGDADLGNEKELVEFFNSVIILVKITFFAPLYLHTLTNNAVHCNSCVRGMCEILVLRNMKWLRKKSEIAKFRSFA